LRAFAAGCWGFLMTARLKTNNMVLVNIAEINIASV